MASKGKVTVTGIESFRSKLDKLPYAIQVRVAKNAVNAGGAQLRMTVRKLIQQNALGDGLNEQGKSRDHLFKNIINKAKSYGKDKIPVATVGAEYNKTPHAHLVHDGTRPHVTPVPAPGLAGKLGRKFKVPHPGARAYPFMTIGMKKAGGRIQKAMVAHLAKGIDKALTKQAGGK